MPQGYASRCARVIFEITKPAYSSFQEGPARLRLRSAIIQGVWHNALAHSDLENARPVMMIVRKEYTACGTAGARQLGDEEQKGASDNLSQAQVCPRNPSLQAIHVLECTDFLL